MSNLPTIPEFPERLYIDLAIGTQAFEDTCWANGVDPDTVRPWEGSPEFQHNLLSAKRAVEDDGRAFRARCRTIVQESVSEMDTLIRDRDVTAGHRIEAFKTLAKLGELEPKEEVRPGAGAGLSLTIIAPGGQRVEVLQGAPAIEGQAEPEDRVAALPTIQTEDWSWPALDV